MKTQMISMISEKELRRILKEELSLLAKQIKNDNTEDDIQYIKIGEVCRILKISRVTVYQLVKNKELDIYKSGRRTYFSKKQALTLISPIAKK
ncbi:helix-turn-helix domain-containing protein [Marinifilum flexuosum]|uniref:helix-turn-helix domain-containing protein n=1 Tax=Marinifilum flexuosum TaxID=1117708 RepID=UPI00249289A4|nr:helix-turn-helix domain-containing protein [Marinifilum flexuosum]